MTPAHSPTVFVAGGAGSVGAGIVSSWLDAGATVVTVSRDQTRIDGLRHAAGEGHRDRLITAAGSASDPSVVGRLADDHGPFDQVVASFGAAAGSSAHSRRWTPRDSQLSCAMASPRIGRQPRPSALP